MQQRAVDQRRINKSMREAKTAIAGIQKADMAEMKTINAPSQAIITVMGCICFLFDQRDERERKKDKKDKKDNDWKKSKKLL